ncbi:MAG: glycoside hydrolase family 92 protein, partial [Bacteroidales bacterium]|nr:glycoside hydrolase family 92 protein [Bacteroidales bacterium]
MRNFKKFVQTTAFLVLLSSIHAQNLTQYVNPFIGTDAHGHTYPGAQVPFGFMQLSPDTRLDGWDGCSGYHYSDSVIYGFSHTHLNGTGVSDYGDILLMPAVGISSPVNYAFASSFDKKNEMAKAGFYSVYLNRPNVQVELTASERCGM